MRQIPSRLRRLDDALADLPLDEPMLLTELDGFLTGIVLGPDPVSPAEWMQSIWGSDADGIPPFDDPLDVRWFADAVMAHHDGIARDLARGKPQPLFDVDERNGELLWDLWVEGFAMAMELRPEAWAALAAADPRAAAALACIDTLIAVARDDGALDSVQIDALHDHAVADLTAALVALHAVRPAPATAPPPAKIGRNDPCRCGSGRKSKRCCG